MHRPMRANLLTAEPDLARYLPPDDVRALGATLETEVIELAPGPWTPPQAPPETGHLGYLLLEGLMIRRVSVDGSRSGELLNRGDVLRPWVEDPISFCDADWQVVEPARLAVLDRAISEKLCARPELNAALMDKQMERARSLSINAATENVRGLEKRLVVLFWHLAERWGHREGGTVVVPLRLTHETLSLLVGARRPSVTTALRGLSHSGTLTRDESGRWLLTGDPPPVSAG
jgi:CRP/FNR family transcriptional regulator, cyclic AMP receptor protein